MAKQLVQLIYNQNPGVFQAEINVYVNPWNIIFFYPNSFIFHWLKFSICWHIIKVWNWILNEKIN